MKGGRGSRSEAPASPIGSAAPRAKRQAGASEDWKTVVIVTKQCQPSLRFSWKFVSIQPREFTAFSLDGLPSSFPAVASSTPSTVPLFNQRQIDAIELLLQDLGSVDPHLQHRASFQCCWRELSQLRSELVNLLISRRHLAREATATPTAGSGDGG
jgi:hypothetical protein